MKSPIARLLFKPQKVAPWAPSAGVALSASTSYRTWPVSASSSSATTTARGFGTVCASNRKFSTRNNDPSQIESGAAVRAAVEALQQQLAATASEKQQRLQGIKTNYGTTQIGTVTPQNVIGGMRGLTALLTETSVLDAHSGLKLHGITMRDLLLEKLPKMNEKHEYPSVESLLWFLLTSKIPTAAQVSLMQRCLYEMSLSTSVATKGGESNIPITTESYTEERFFRVPAVLPAVLKSIPQDGHPMVSLAAASASLSNNSFFRKSTEAGLFNKKELWKPALVDALTLFVRAAVTAAHIYRNKYGDGKVALPDPNLDFAANFSRMLGFESEEQMELLRLYLLLHADHEGGNVSAHAAHLVGSALADPFAAYGAGMAGLGGPLHGLANQQCLSWLRSVHVMLEGASPTFERIREIAVATLKSGNVIPGFGHAVLRVTDPRFTLQREFALRHIQHDPLFRLLEVVREVVPEVLGGKVANPYPNVDCHSGVLLQAFGLKEENFYTVLFGVSRSMGIGSQFVWARALGLPIERPKSVTINCLEELCAQKKQ